MSSQVLGQPTISFTFDDGVTNDYPGYPFEVWNRMLLNKLDNAEINAIFFVTGHNKIDQKGKFLLESWNGQGHKIANHTYSHPNYNHDEVSTTAFAGEILRTDSVISNYENCIKLFRFPYLKEGNTEEKVDSIRQFLQAQGYRNGYVTIDASDWYINSRLRKRLANDPQSPVEGYKQFYLDHLFDRAQFYENLSYELTGRHIHHTLLLHHNLAAALFLDDLIEMFKAKGWKVVSADKAYEDPVFDKTPKFAGESLIYALAKDAGRFSNKLRYPAEDGKYEKEKMDRLGL
ncbi:MAG: polysaccharide deacetylase family protein [Bacteroidota bacterium]